MRPPGLRERLREAVESIVPGGCALRVWSGATEPKLFDEEARAVGRAVRSRRVEFARGRACAREALAALGVSAGPIPVGSARQPVWPTGFVGSITHCHDLVAAVAAADEGLRAIGLDAEPARPLPPEVPGHVVHPTETLPEGRPLLQTVLFSAKESIHKALFPLEGVALDFLDVRLSFDLGAGSFRAEAAPGARRTAEHLSALEGGFLIGEDHVATYCWLRA